MAYLKIEKLNFKKRLTSGRIKARKRGNNLLVVEVSFPPASNSLLLRGKNWKMRGCCIAKSNKKKKKRKKKRRKTLGQNCSNRSELVKQKAQKRIAKWKEISKTQRTLKENWTH